MRVACPQRRCNPSIHLKIVLASHKAISNPADKQGGGCRESHHAELAPFHSHSVADGLAKHQAASRKVVLQAWMDVQAEHGLPCHLPTCT